MVRRHGKCLTQARPRQALDPTGHPCAAATPWPPQPRGLPAEHKLPPPARKHRGLFSKTSSRCQCHKQQTEPEKPAQVKGGSGRLNGGPPKTCPPRSWERNIRKKGLCTCNSKGHLGLSQEARSPTTLSLREETRRRPREGGGSPERCSHKPRKPRLAKRSARSRKRWGGLPLTSGEREPAHTGVADGWPPELRDNTFLLLYAT